MRCVVRLVFLAFVPCFLVVGNASASTHYIATNGSDSNNGTSLSTPWAHLPGMRTWTGSYTPVAGDTFILRGCDTWGNASFPISWTWAGASGNPIVIGVDQTWYNTSACPSGWNRPIFDGQDAEMGGGSGNAFIVQLGNYVTWDWIEAKRIHWTSQNATCVDMTSGSGFSGITIDHWYIHAWSHSNTTSDLFACLRGRWPGGINDVVQHTVFDGSDSAGGGDSGNFSYHWRSAKWNVIHDAQNAIHTDYASATSPTEIAYNTIYHIGWVNKLDGNEHENEISIGGCGNDGDCTFYIHDNIEYDNPAGMALMFGKAGETDYVWNNVVASTWNGYFAVPSESSTQAKAEYIWDNTIVPSNIHQPVSGRGNLACFAFGTGISPPLQIYFRRNNHCISDNSLGAIPGGFATTVVDDHNVTVGSVAAASQGYDQTGTYFYAPTSSNCNGMSTNCPIGVGANGTGDQYWPSGFSTSDTTYSCDQGTVNGVEQSICPARTSNNRPSSGVWDVGAYQFGLTSGTAPKAPTNLAASVQ